MDSPKFSRHYSPTMTTVEADTASQNWSEKLRQQANALVGLASTSSSKYDQFKHWLAEELEVTPSVCYLSDLHKQWTARVGQAFMGLPSLLVLLIEGQPQSDVVKRLEKLHGYATGLEATLVFFGSECSWTLDSVVGLPASPAFDLVRGSMSSSPKKDSNVKGRPRVAKPGGQFFDRESESQAELAWQHLVGHGSMPIADAIATAAKALRDDGLLDFTRLRTDGLVYSELEAAISYASRRGFLFDRPKRGCVRALKGDPDEFTRDDWRTCLLTSLSTEWVDRDAAISDAALHAVDVFGLNMVRLRSGGRVDTALRSALNGLIRLGEVERDGPQLIRRNEQNSQPKIDGQQVIGADSAMPRNEPRPEPPHPNATPTARSETTAFLVTTPLPQKQVKIEPVRSLATPAQLRRLVGHLPSEAEVMFERLLSIPQKTVTEMRDAVGSHLRKFERAFEDHQFLDMGGAALLAEQAEELLQNWDELTPEQRRIAQAAIEYFVESEEGDDDFVLDGLRTDKAVMAAVLDALT